MKTQKTTFGNILHILIQISKTHFRSQSMNSIENAQKHKVKNIK